MSEFVNLNAENLDCEHLCCIIRKKPHPGVDAKREWLRARLSKEVRLNFRRILR